MSQPLGNCPSCGAPVQFRWSSAVQAMCPFCRSILVRTDVKIEDVGKIADLPPDPSPIQLLTEGTYKGKKFEVIGRLIYEYEQGRWNEWHIVMSDGASGWLSDAQLLYAVSFQAPLASAPPDPQQSSRGSNYRINGKEFQITTVTRARYKGFEGELPFAYHGIEDTVFADLRTAGKEFATIDYSDNPPLLFLGEWVEFEELQLKNLRQFEGWKQ